MGHVPHEWHDAGMLCVVVSMLCCGHMPMFYAIFTRSCGSLATQHGSRKRLMEHCAAVQATVGQHIYQLVCATFGVALQGP